MIVTVTLNPAVDKTVLLDHFVYAGLNRLQSAQMDAGGKGINVSKTIHALGGESIATGFLGEENRGIFQKCFAEYGIRDEFLGVPGYTRTNLKVTEPGGALTELNEQGPLIGEDRQEALLEKLRQMAGPDVLFVLSGSLPRGVAPDFYARIMAAVRQKGSEAVLDADGERFALALETGPVIIKPNDFELGQYFHLDGDPDDARRIACGRKLLDKGIAQVCISSGGKGSMMITKDHIWAGACLHVNVRSTVGAGDAMVAALAYAHERRLPAAEGYRLAIAASAGAVTTAGTQPPEMELVEELKKQVVLKELA